MAYGMYSNSVKSDKLIPNMEQLECKYGGEKLASRKLKADHHLQLPSHVTGGNTI